LAKHNLIPKEYNYVANIGAMRGLPKSTIIIALPGAHMNRNYIMEELSMLYLRYKIIPEKVWEELQ
jgi:hypothetical protein